MQCHHCIWHSPQTPTLIGCMLLKNNRFAFASRRRRLISEALHYDLIFKTVSSAWLFFAVSLRLQLFRITALRFVSRAENYDTLFEAPSTSSDYYLHRPQPPLRKAAPRAAKPTTVAQVFRPEQLLVAYGTCLLICPLGSHGCPPAAAPHAACFASPAHPAQPSCWPGFSFATYTGARRRQAQTQAPPWPALTLLHPAPSRPCSPSRTKAPPQSTAPMPLGCCKPRG